MALQCNAKQDGLNYFLPPTLDWGATPDCREPTDAGKPFYQLAEYNANVVQSLLLVGLALPMNLFILAVYFFAAPPHPKFLLRRWNQVSVYLHIASGSVEVICGAVMWFLPYPDHAVMVQSIMALIHCATCLNQIPLLFGTKVIMNPAYSICVGIKMYLAVSCLHMPHCYRRALALTCIHTIYAWVRAVWVFLNSMDIMKDSQYTVAVICAGMIVLPVASMSYNAFLVLAIVGYYVVVRCTHDRISFEELYCTEFSRDAKIFQDFHCPFRHQKDQAAHLNWYGAPVLEAPPGEQLQAVWNMLDQDQTGTMELLELAQLMMSCGMPPYEVDRTMKLYEDDHEVITFEIFKTKMKPMWEYMYREAVMEDIRRRIRAFIARSRDNSYALMSKVGSAEAAVIAEAALDEAALRKLDE